MAFPKRTDRTDGPQDPPFTLRIWSDDAEPAPHVEPPPAADIAADGDGIRLSNKMRLSEIQKHWFIPEVLEGQLNRKPKTIASHLESMAKWIEITGDPPVFELDLTLNGGSEKFTTMFLKGLRERLFRKPGLRSKPKKLAKHTIAKHITQIKAVLDRIGPTYDRRKRGLNLVAETPYMSGARPRSVPKDPIELEDARTIFAAAKRMTTPKKLKNPALWWQAFIAVLYYTGLRLETALELRAAWLKKKGNDHWLHIPGEVVKRDKTMKQYLRAEAGRLLERLIDDLEPGEELIFGKHRHDYVRDRHERLMTIAGIPRERWQAFHGYRRLHGAEIGLLGARRGIKAAQRALNHDDEETTRDHYVALETAPELIKAMPALDQRDLFEELA